MEIAKLVLEYVKVLVWPCFVTALMVIFRDQARAFIEDVTELVFPGGSIKRDKGDRTAAQLKMEVATRIIDSVPVTSGLTAAASVDGRSESVSDPHEESRPHPLAGWAETAAILARECAAKPWDLRGYTSETRISRAAADLASVMRVIEHFPATLIKNLVAEGLFDNTELDLKLPGELISLYVDLIRFAEAVTDHAVAITAKGAADFGDSVGIWFTRVADFLEVKYGPWLACSRSTDAGLR